MKLPFFCFFLFFSALFAYEKTTTVESDFASYDGQELLLKGHVSVENSLGKVHAEKALLKRDLEGKSKIDFPFIEVSENVSLTLAEGGLLKCQRVLLNSEKLESVFTSDSQVHYHDEKGEVFADIAKVDYEEKEKSYKAKKITLIGHVKMVNNGYPQKKDKALSQFALADIVEYFPSEGLMLLKAEGDHRVLFFDHVKEVELSAKEICAKRNPADGKESVKGFGDVRFLFKQEELEDLKKHFKFDRRKE